MNPAEFAEVARILRKPRHTKADCMKIDQAYCCLIAIFGKKRVQYLCRLVDADNVVIKALEGIKG